MDLYLYRKILSRHIPHRIPFFNENCGANKLHAIILKHKKRTMAKVDKIYRVFADMFDHSVLKTAQQEHMDYIVLKAFEYKEPQAVTKAS